MSKRDFAADRATCDARPGGLWPAALDEIDRLRAVLTQIAAYGDGGIGPHMCEPHAAAKARAALEDNS